MRLLRGAVARAAPRFPLLGRALACDMAAAAPLKSVDYEVFGRVQGVCFRMYTENEAKKIGVVGWVKNTSKGTVTGQVQGPEEKVNSMSTKYYYLHVKDEGFGLRLIMDAFRVPWIITELYSTMGSKSDKYFRNFQDLTCKVEAISSFYPKITPEFYSSTHETFAFKMSDKGLQKMKYITALLASLLEKKKSRN